MQDVDALSVGEIREKLINDHGFSEEEAKNIKGKDNLRQILKDSINAEMADNQMFGDSVEDYINDNYPEEDNAKDAISRTSPDWSEYVMGFFSEDEVMEKDGNRYPTLKGLRRVFCMIYGNPVFSGIINYSAPTDENSPGRAYANYELVTRDGTTYRGAAEAYPGNINGGYHVYPLAIAENRAEARTYRKALMLNVVTAEEIGNESSHFTSVLSSSGEFNEEEPISDSQMVVIKNKCKELNVDENKFLEFVKKELGVSKLSKKVGLAAIKQISIMSNDPNKIPGDLR